MSKANTTLTANNITQADDLAAAGVTEVQEDPNSYTLDEPIVRGSQTITKVTLRRPKSGELRGVTLSDLVNLDVAALSRVLPRISSPTLTEQDVANLDPADLVQLGGIFSGFLMTKAIASKVASLTA
ncbi:phage tail assembly protein [Paraburkholderia fungorum]|uniref:Phage tail protein n=1 Tax=Paraburkholderia fungorum TaxID=134537 RepID=A0A3R7E2H5_9BURK|nr:phage tail assembly protein [Paraburkholderia fungorum]RKF33402.1 phage tail protein [Paraburkholderia fungorum]